MSPGERRSVLTVPLVLLIRLYQRTLSVLFGPVCGYYPSCSAYGVTALERHGLLRGTALTVWRVLRCNPWSAGGVDHVPPPRGEAAARDSAAAPHPVVGTPHTHITPVSPAHHEH
nr:MULTISPECIES: membrane protein insertion efficiency factor YidD [unclassified Ornithinimicrobium]